MLQGGKNQGLRPLLQLFCNIFKNIFVFLKVKMLHGGKSDHRLAPTSGCCRWRLPVSGRYVPSKTYYKSFPSKPDGMLRINFYFQKCFCFQFMCPIKALLHSMLRYIMFISLNILNLKLETLWKCIFSKTYHICTMSYFLNLLAFDQHVSQNPKNVVTSEGKPQ